MTKNRYHQRHNTTLPIVHSEGYIDTQGVIRTTKAVTKQRLLQDSGGRGGEDEWEWGSLREETEWDGEAEV